MGSAPRNVGGRLTSTVHLAIAGVLFALSATLFCAILYGVYAAADGARSAAQTLGDKLEEQQMLGNAMRLLDMTKKERATLGTLPIPQGGGAGFIGEIESLGKVAGVGVTITNVGVVPPQGNIPGSFTMTVQISGGFAACDRFVRLIETLPEGVTISSLSLNANVTAATSTWDGSFDLAAVSFDTP